MATSKIGLTEVLNEEGFAKFILLAVDDEPGILKKPMLRTFIQNHWKLQNVKLTLVNMVHRDTVSSVDSTRLKRLDYISNSFPGLDELYQELKSSTSNNQNRQMLIIDDLALLWLMSDRDEIKFHSFMVQLYQMFAKVLILTVTGSLKGKCATSTMSAVCNVADRLCHIRERPEEAPGFLCNVLTMKPSGKTFVDTTYVTWKRGAFQDIPVPKEVKADRNSNAEDVMKNLTTFKLTVEENEKSSREMLNLPYFDAQRMSVPNPDDEYLEDLEDDDDED